MPRARRDVDDPTTSENALGAALETAPDAEATWQLLQSWRKRRVEAIDVAARSIRHWDQGLVFLVIEAGYVSAVGGAVANPSWPKGWADNAVINWAIGSLSSETAQDPLARAGILLKELQRTGRFSATHPATDTLVQLLDGRDAMTARQMAIAELLLHLDGLSVEVYNHVATAVSRSQVVRAGITGRNYTESQLLRSLLNHPQATEEWVRLCGERAGPALAIVWSRLLSTFDRWKNTTEGTEGRAEEPATAGPRRAAI